MMRRGRAPLAPAGVDPGVVPLEVTVVPVDPPPAAVPGAGSVVVLDAQAPRITQAAITAAAAARR
jgi:hypothetical protein